MNKNVDIKIFDILDAIRAKYNILAGEWADGCGYKQPRISELRRISELTREGKDPSVVKRQFTLDKMLDLTNSLKRLVGVEVVEKEIMKALETVKDRDQKMHLMCMLAPDDKKDQLIMYMEALFGLKKLKVVK